MSEQTEIETPAPKQRHPNVIKAEADGKQKELNAVNREIIKLDVDLELADKRKAFSNVNKIETLIRIAKYKKYSIEKELDELRKEAFSSWIPKGGE